MLPTYSDYTNEPYLIPKLCISAWEYVYNEQTAECYTFQTIPLKVNGQDSVWMTELAGKHVYNNMYNDKAFVYIIR